MIITFYYYMKISISFWCRRIQLPFIQAPKRLWIFFFLRKEKRINDSFYLFIYLFIFKDRFNI